MKPLYYIILFTMGAMFSCNKDFLNKYPLDAPSNVTFFSNEEQLDMALNGAYTGLWLESYGAPFPLWLEATTDISWSRGDFAGVQSIQSGNYTPELGFFEDTWSHMYESISKCNNLLQNMYKAKDKVDSKKYTQIEAQAKFLRSFYYFYLIELFGDVPWVTTMLPLDSAQMPKTSKKEIVNYLYKDLNFAASNLPPTWSGSDKGRATKGAALTLKARLALYEGDYKVADSAAKAVMDEEGIYSIYPDYGELFRYSGEENSKEIIFILSYLKGVRTNHIPQILGVHSAGATWSILVPTQRMVDIYECTDGKPIDESPLFDPSHPFKNRDPRLDQSIIRQGTWFNNTLFDPHPDSAQTLQVIDGDTVRVDNKDITTYATFTGYGWRKYMDEADCPDDITSSEMGVILMRYAEVLLTYAEAKIELNEIDQSVIDAINEVRQRPSVNMPPVSLGMSQDALREIVRYERTVELAGEGLRLFDIRRWKYAEHVLNGNVLGKRTKAHWYDAITPQIDQWQHSVYSNEKTIFSIISVNKFDLSKDYLWPIPQKAVEVNPKLK